VRQSDAIAGRRESGLEPCLSRRKQEEFARRSQQNGSAKREDGIVSAGPYHNEGSQTLPSAFATVIRARDQHHRGAQEHHCAESSNEDLACHA
jgi:hypothetical protein